MAFDLKKSLATLAPTLASMLGGPMAGMAVTALEGALGLAPGAGQAGITEVMQGAALTPETAAAIRAADEKHAEIMGQQGIDILKLNADADAAKDQVAAGDRDSARKMQIAKPSYWPGVLATVTTVAVVGIIIASMFGAKLPSEPVAVQLIGSLTTGWGSCLAYWVGTTRNSANKDALLAQSVPS